MPSMYEKAQWFGRTSAKLETLTLTERSTVPAFSDQERNARVFTPTDVAWNVQAADRLSLATMSPRVRLSAVTNPTVRPSFLPVCTLSRDTPEELEVF